ncbi:DUF58 domain-containing protein [Leucobacter sp. 1207-22]|uniref:DUF58 domain-containing protein n=1 Tax=Leucobacter sp. 1207-22 TaxID=2604456 RepID=UPI00406442F6
MLHAVTPLGWFVIGVTVVGLILGSAYGWVEAWYVSLVGIILLLIAGPFLIGSRTYEVAINLDRDHVVAGGAIEIGIKVHNNSARPAFPALAELPVGPALRELAIPFLTPRQEKLLPTSVPTVQRGVIPVGPLTIARRDPLSLLRREVTWEDRKLVHVHPPTVQLPTSSSGMVRDIEGIASRRIVDSDLSFYAVREYVPGDSIRHIHWKSTARTGKTMVRQYEETQTARVAVLFDAIRDEYANDEEFELGVGLAASLSLQAVREGRDRFVASGWVPNGRRARIDGLEEIPSREAVQLMNAWSALQPMPEAQPIEVLANTLAHSLRDLSVVMIVTGSHVSFERLRRAAITFAGDVHVLAIRADMHADPRMQRLGAVSLFTAGALEDLPQLLVRSLR